MVSQTLENYGNLPVFFKFHKIFQKFQWKILYFSNLSFKKVQVILIDCMNSSNFVSQLCKSCIVQKSILKEAEISWINSKIIAYFFISEKNKLLIFKISWGGKNISLWRLRVYNVNFVTSKISLILILNSWQLCNNIFTFIKEFITVCVLFIS